VERVGAVGVNRCFFFVRPEEPGEVERQLDELAELRDRVAMPRTA
jgi:hypothetical protein